jgi:hypothetical protein
VIVRFLADEDIKGAVVDGLRLREPSIDFFDVKTRGLRGTKDADLLELANNQGRVLISYDRQTMIDEFWKRLTSGKGSAGLCIFSQGERIGVVIDALLLVWGASTAEECRDTIMFLPYR